VGDEPTDPTPPDPLDRLFAAPDAAEPAPDRLGQLAWRVAIQDAKIAFLAGLVARQGVPSGAIAERVARLAEDEPWNAA
jgi:hypothetical protein